MQQETIQASATIIAGFILAGLAYAFSWTFLSIPAFILIIGGSYWWKEEDEKKEKIDKLTKHKNEGHISDTEYSKKVSEISKGIE